VAELQLAADVQAMSVAVAPDGRVMLVGLSNGSIAVYETESRKLLRTLEGHVAPVYDLAFSPDGTAFASTAGQHDPRLWKKEGTGEFGKGEGASVGAAAALSPSLERDQALGVFVWLLGGVNSARMVGAPALGPAPVGSSAEAHLEPAARAIPLWCLPRVTFSPDGRYFASSASLMRNPGSLMDPKIPIFLTDLGKGDTKAIRHTSCVVTFTPVSKFVITSPGPTFVAAPDFWDVETFQRVDVSTPEK
jgi:WD40 repeat protein